MNFLEIVSIVYTRAPYPSDLTIAIFGVLPAHEHQRRSACMIADDWGLGEKEEIFMKLIKK